MLNTDNTDRQESKDQQQLSVSNRTAHDEQYPFLSEFSELIAKLSIEELLELTTYQQRNFAKSLWEAENYGGSRVKCEKRLKEIHGPKWYEITSIKEHMADIREYYELVLRIDHKRQWDEQWKKQENSAKLQITSDLE
tara:strand:- start:2028 stop:2441 length:414 start_codon:yes stop_codon:yes gene_type:complete